MTQGPWTTLVEEKDSNIWEKDEIRVYDLEVSGTATVHASTPSPTSPNASSTTACSTAEAPAQGTPSVDKSLHESRPAAMAAFQFYKLTMTSHGFSGTDDMQGKHVAIAHWELYQQTC